MDKFAFGCPCGFYGIKKNIRFYPLINRRMRA